MLEIDLISNIPLHVGPDDEPSKLWSTRSPQIPNYCGSSGGSRDQLALLGISCGSVGRAGRSEGTAHTRQQIPPLLETAALLQPGVLLSSQQWRNQTGLGVLFTWNMTVFARRRFAELLWVAELSGRKTLKECTTRGLIRCSQGLGGHIQNI